MRQPYYYDRQVVYNEAIELRKQGYGYRSIANQLLNKIPWGTIRGWVKHIPIDSKKAHEKATILRKKKNPEELISQEAIRKLIIAERGHRCEKCTLIEWLGKLISIELHHIDGDKKNNKRENLKLLCPNCHSQTDNYRNKKNI